MFSFVLLSLSKLLALKLDQLICQLQEADDRLAGSPHKVLQFPSVGILLALG